MKVMIEPARKGYLGEEKLVVICSYRLPKTDLHGEHALYERFLKESARGKTALESIKISYLSENKSLEGIPKSEAMIKTGNRSAPIDSHNGTSYNEFSVELVVEKVRDGNFVDKVYIPGIDTVIDFVTDRTLGTTKHPLDSETMSIERLKQYFGTSSGISVNIELVVNSDEISHRYVNILTGVEKIIPVMDGSRDAGLYITVINHSTGAKNSVAHSLDSIEEYGLYRTVEEAEVAGDLKTKLEMELTSMKGNLLKTELMLKEAVSGNHRQKLELEAARDKAISELAVDKAEREAAFLKYKQEIEAGNLNAKNEYEERSRNRDDYYDGRSSSRKDTSEVFKFVPAVLSVAAIAFALFK
jgi:hypothetical protein